MMDRTKADPRVLLSHVVTLLIGEEHIGRETTLGCIRVYEACSVESLSQWRHGRHTLLLLAFAHSLALALTGGGGLFLRHSDLYGGTC